jgi:8-oxo-dGTP pyrophosphatase MutT (NUDIX family)
MKTFITEPLIFGSPETDAEYTERLAAYVVIVAGDGRVAMVMGGQGYFLPGGGSLPSEAPGATIVREVREELARGVRLLREIGTAIQYFYSSTDRRHYRMHATFFAGAFTGESPSVMGEHELQWLLVEEVERACFHACHAWAVRQA